MVHLAIQTCHRGGYILSPEDIKIKKKPETEHERGCGHVCEVARWLIRPFGYVVGVLWVCHIGFSPVSENSSKRFWKSNISGWTYIGKTPCAAQSKPPSVLAPGKVPAAMPHVTQD